jgi:hypothetical protein
MKTTRVAAKKSVPFEFVLELLEPLSPITKPMFGCTAVYVGEKIVMILREKADEVDDNGMWLATTPEHHPSLVEEFPMLRSIGVLGPAPTGWQNIPSRAAAFEEAAVRACELILAGDPRIGKVPRRRSLKPKKAGPRRPAAR